jgi:molybdopterin converting factor small subunit
MSVSVLFFGATADVVGSRKIETNATTSTELLENILSEYPRLASHKLLVAVNQDYASDTVPLNDGDEVAIFTAVSGG